jgi:hypothetical protein
MDRQNKKGLLMENILILILAFGILPNRINAQMTSATKTVTENLVGMGQHEYGVWVQKHATKPVGTPANFNNLFYQNYTNLGLGFELKYPKGILFPSPSDSFNDNKHLVKMAVCRKKVLSGNDFGKEFQEVLDSFKDAEITYKVFKKNFFVISGFRGSEVVYRKELVVSGDESNEQGPGILVLDMTFPKQEKAKWDPILTICANSIKQIPEAEWNENRDSVIEQKDADNTELAKEGQNTLNEKPVPTWTQEQWEDADKDESAKEQELEADQQIREGAFTPVPFTKDFTPNAPKPSPPSHLKITTLNGMAFLSWDKVDGARAYIIYGSPDGKSFKARRNPIKDTKLFVGYVITLKQQPVHYYGIETLSWSGDSEMVTQAIGPTDFDVK